MYTIFTLILNVQNISLANNRIVRCYSVCTLNNSSEAELNNFTGVSKMLPASFMKGLKSKAFNSFPTEVPTALCYGNQ